MSQLIISYLIAIGIFLVADFVWLGTVAKDFYQRQIGHLMTESVKFDVALVFYLMYMVGLVIFVIKPALNNGGWQQAALYGALFGLFTYGTYDFTNWATLKEWPATMVFVDIAWGMGVTALCAGASVYLTKMITG